LKSYDETTDLAILTVGLNRNQCPALPLAHDISHLSSAHRVVSVGHPGGSRHQFLSAGPVTGLYRTHRQIDAANSKGKAWAGNQTGEVGSHAVGGMSGSPAFADGQVVGVVQSRVGNTGMVFTPVEDVRALLADQSKTVAEREAAAAREKAAKERAGICDYEEGRADIAKRIEAKKLVNAEFSDGGPEHGLKRVYKFSDGVEYTVYDKSKTCSKAR
jgi:hypothetical protein